MGIPDRFDICYIDCDLIAYRSSFSAEKTFYHLYDENGGYIDKFSSAKLVDEHLEELSEFLMIDVEGYRRESEKVIGTLEQATGAADLIINSIKKACPADQYKLYLTGNDTYRPSIATLFKYKGNRDKVVKPKWIKEVRQHLIDTHKAKVVDVIECDDVLSVGLHNCYKQGKLAVAANLDKDVRQAPSFHYDWVKDEFLYVTPEDGLHWSYTQALIGDSTDHYFGVPGIGKAKAKTILKGCTTEREMYEAAVKAYREYFGDEYRYTSWDGRQMVKGPEDLFLENMQLAYMLKEKDKFYTIPEED